MIKRLSIFYSFKFLVVKSINTKNVISFLGVEYKAVFPVKLILKTISGVNFFGLLLLCKQFNIPCSLPLTFFNEVQLVELKTLVLRGSFLSLGGFHISKRISNYCVSSLHKKTEKEHIVGICQTGFLRAIRIRCGLPVRGQRTKTNAQTSRRFFTRLKN
jgi:ribosomal protein S13